MHFNIPISPLEVIAEHPGKEAGVALFIKRDDLLHPDIQGNKWRKLAPVLSEVKQSHPGGIVTFGGPYSNHLQAVAAAGRVFDIPTIGIVRGQYADLGNPTLRAARRDGMLLVPVSKQDYDTRKHLVGVWTGQDLSRHLILPEGGSSRLAVEHCAAITQEIISQLRHQHLADQPLYICSPAGTGCTAAGIVDGFEGINGQILVFPVVNKGFEPDTLLHLLHDVRLRTPAEIAALARRFSLVREYEFGGFAKRNPLVLEFARSFQQQTGILLDPVYTSKMMFGVYNMLTKGVFPPGSIVVVVHTGGLQGWDGFRERWGVAP